MLSTFLKALNNSIHEETKLAGQVSREEWEAIRPTKPERRSTMLEGVKSQLVATGKCDNCTLWQMKAGDTWGTEYDDRFLGHERIQHVGWWKLREGPLMIDHLFPNVGHGFRGRNLPLISFHVNTFLFSFVIIIILNTVIMISLLSYSIRHGKSSSTMNRGMFWNIRV